MTVPELRKQISIFLPLSDWRRLRAEAIRRRVPMTEICRNWLEPGLDRLRRRELLPDRRSTGASMKRAPCE